MGSGHRVAIALGVVVVALVGLVVGLPLLAIVPGAGQAPANAPSGIPNRVLDAYRAVDGWCPGLRWQLLAGTGAIESGHGTTRGTTIDPASGEVTPWIFGPPLDGSAGTERLPIGPWVGWFG